jgi:MFS family permease
MVKKILKTYYLITFAFSLAMSFFFATYVLFLTDAGLNFFQVNLINAAFMLAGFFLEIPTGALADSYGRKFSFVCSCFILSISMIVYFFSTSFWWFILAEIICALAMAFYSGAFEAWLVDSIRFYDQKYDMIKVFKSSAQIDKLGLVIGSVAGAYAGKIDLALPWLLSGIGMLIVGIISQIIMKEEYFIRQPNGQNGFNGIKKIASESIKFGLKSKPIFWIILAGAILGFAFQPLNMYWQIRFSQQLGVATEYLGWLFAGAVIAMFIGAELSKKFLEKLSEEKQAIMLSILLISLGIIAAAISNILWLALVGYYLHELARGSLKPLSKKYINDHALPEKRATIISFESMIVRGGCFVGLLVSGKIADMISIEASWLFAGLFLIFGVIVLKVIK